MLYLVTSLLFFFLSVVVHIFWCRRQKKQDLHMTTFCLIALTVLGCYGMFLAFIQKAFQGQFGLTFWSCPLQLTSIVLYVLFIPIYLIFYFGTRVESPSKKMVLLIEQHGALSPEDFLKYFSDEHLVLTRLDDLERSYCVVLENKVYRLTDQGRTIARVLNLYQWITGRVIGG